MDKALVIGGSGFLRNAFTHARAARDFECQPIVPLEPVHAETIECLKQAGFAK
jgi:hypothetical protein